MIYFRASVLRLEGDMRERQQISLAVAVQWRAVMERLLHRVEPYQDVFCDYRLRRNTSRWMWVGINGLPWSRVNGCWKQP